MDKPLNFKAFLKYFGGKWTKRKHIIKHFPYCNNFYSVFLGSGGVEFSSGPFKNEFWNDINQDLMNLYLCLQSKEHYPVFKNVLEQKTFSEKTFLSSKNFLNLPIEPIGISISRAVAFYCCNRMSRGGDGKAFHTPSSRLRRGVEENLSSWISSIKNLDSFHNRLSYVFLKNMDFRDFIEMNDSKDSFFYLDPPYLQEKRVAGGYQFEMSDKDHLELLDMLSKIKGKFLLHGLDSGVYKSFENSFNWNRSSYINHKSSSSSKTKPLYEEIMWKNY